MPTNEQRRATAKRKLERQLERRAAKERKRRLYTIVGSAVAAVVVIAAVVATVVLTKHDSDSQTASAATHHADLRAQRRPAAPGQLPAFAAPANWATTASTRRRRRRRASRSSRRAPARCPTDPAQVSASMATNQGNIGLQLDNAKAPCTVNSFASLAQQGSSTTRRATG